MNDSENKIYQNTKCDKNSLAGTFIALNAFIKKQEN